MINKSILLGTKNPHKQRKILEIVAPFFKHIETQRELPEAKETKGSFCQIAEEKAEFYSRWFNGYAVSTDGGAIIPALTKDEWEPLRTSRFGVSDEERIYKLLELMKDKTDRRVGWLEAIAIAHKGRTLFSATAEAMEGTIDYEYNPAYYREGIWLCSITSYPQFGGRNFFELTPEEQEKTEDSWSLLGQQLQAYLRVKKGVKYLFFKNLIMYN